MAISKSGVSFTEWKKKNPMGSYSAWKKAPKQVGNFVHTTSDKGEQQRLKVPKKTNQGTKPVTSGYKEWKATGATHAGGYQGYVQAKADEQKKVADDRQKKIDAYNKKTGSTMTNATYDANKINGTTSQSQDTSLSQTYTPTKDSDYDLRVKAQMAQDQQDRHDAGTDLFGEDNPILKSSLDLKVDESVEKRKAKELLKKQEEDRKYLEEQQKRQEELDAAAYGRFHDQATSAMGATDTAFATSLNGPQAATDPMLAQEYTGEMKKQINEASIRLDAARAQRDRVKKDLLEAQKQGRESMVKAYQLQLANAENRVKQMDTDYQDSINTATKNALDIQYKTAQINNQAFAMFDKMPAGGLANMEIGDISAMMGVDTVTANTLKAFDEQRSTLDPNDPNYAINKAKIDKATNEARYAGMTTEMKNFTQYQDLLKINPTQAEAFAKSAGIIDSPTALQVAQTEKINQEKALDYYNEFGVMPPINSKYPVKIIDGGIEWGVQAGTYKEGRDGWCGGFANDCLTGTSGFYGDSFKSKMQKNNSKIPVAGGGFIEWTGDSAGHVGVVEKVYKDGSFDIRDSNYSAPGTVDTDHIVPGSKRYNNIVNKGGFTDMSKINKKPSISDFKAEALKLKLSASDQKSYVKLRQQGFEKNELNGAYDLADAVMSGTTELKGLTPTMAANVIPILKEKGYKETVAKEIKQEVAGITSGLDDIVKKYEAIKSMQKGLIHGRLSKAYGLQDVEPAIAEFEQATGIIGMQLTRLFEKGRISDADREFYLGRMPNIRMNQASVEASAEELKRLLSNKITDHGDEIISLIEGEIPVEGKTDLEMYNSYSPDLSWDQLTQ